MRRNLHLFACAECGREIPDASTVARHFDGGCDAMRVRNLVVQISVSSKREETLKLASVVRDTLARASSEGRTLRDVPGAEDIASAVGPWRMTETGVSRALAPEVQS